LPGLVNNAASPRTPRESKLERLKTFFYLNELRPAVNRENTSRQIAGTRRGFPKTGKGQHERAVTHNDP
jgi:hypothetical protein